MIKQYLFLGIHAREWVAPAMALYLIHRLTNDPDAIHNELKGVDWYILPVVNPDGYEFTRSNKSVSKHKFKTNDYNRSERVHNLNTRSFIIPESTLEENKIKK